VYEKEVLEKSRTYRKARMGFFIGPSLETLSKYAPEGVEGQ
jgi:hypothetical protein